MTLRSRQPDDNARFIDRHWEGDRLSDVDLVFRNPYRGDISQIRNDLVPIR